MEETKPMPRRHSTRLPEYDYTRAGACFVTICTQGRECVLGTVQEDRVQLTRFGGIVNADWSAIPGRFPSVELDTYVIMPNHLHCLIVICDVGAGSPHPSPREKGVATTPLQRPNLGQIIAWFKYRSTKNINAHRQTAGTRFWQRNYYEHVIRNENELTRAREYITTNPLRWHIDSENPDCTPVDTVDASNSDA